MNKIMAGVFAIVAAFALTVEYARAEVFITVDKSTQTMYVETPTDSFIWKVSTGRKGHTTPSGNFKPYLLKPMHYSRKYDNAPMPNTIFFHGGYAIHATDAVGKLGSPASHGCVRLSPRDAKWLYRIVRENGKENTFIRIVN